MVPVRGGALGGDRSISGAERRGLLRGFKGLFTVDSFGLVTAWRGGGVSLAYRA